MSQQLFADILQGQISSQLEVSFPFWPLTAPQMPPPGDDFVAAAIALGDPPPSIEGSGDNKRLVSHGPALHYLYRQALYNEQFAIHVNVKGSPKLAQCVPGHLLGDETTNYGGGPRAARVMVIGKNPGTEEVRARRNFVGPSSSILFDALDELGVPDSERSAWYVDNLIHWPQLDTQSDGIPVSQKKDCAVLLAQTLRLVRPDFILCLGSDASKFLFGSAYGVTSLVGRAMDLNIPIFNQGESPLYHRARVMAVTHPAQVYRRPEMYDEFKTQVALFLSLCNGADIGGAETGLNHQCVYTERALKRIVDEIRNDPDPERRIIAVDAEWNGLYPTEANAYLRTIQFSSKHGEGITVVLRHQGGSQAFQPSIESAIAQLRRLLKWDRAQNWYPRVGGHFLRADMPWLIDAGLDLREEFMAAPTPDACRHQGGWDTGLMYHAVNEATSYRLTDMLVRLTTAPVYDARIKELVTDYCKANDIKKEDLEGYGFLADWELHPYACYDSDVTRRIAMRHFQAGGLLDADWFGNSSWEPFWRSQRAALGFLEMEANGMMLDKPRTDELTQLFSYVKEKLLESFRQKINWPEFNPGSAPQCVAFLFGDRYSAKRDRVTGATIPVRPPGALSLNLEPVKSTGKRSRLWADLVARGEAGNFNPSSDKEVLGIVGHAHPLAMQLRDLKFISQVLSGPLRAPTFGDDGVPVTDEDGYMTYEKGLASFVMRDGRVRTHFSQCKETGRASSARPPLQNLSSRREGDYKRILGIWDKKNNRAKGDYTDIFPTALYSHPLRSILRAEPDWVFVGTDLTGAEMAVLAWLSDDVNMIEHVRRNNLPESDPLHYDIHSNTAVRVFQLQCPPTKTGLEKAGHKSLRVAAKNVNFGIPYGRSAGAIARQCREEGVDVTEDDCQRMIEFYFSQYPRVQDFLAECRRRSQQDRFMAGSYGRWRRFISSRDRSVVGEQERQAQNFAIQNTVADNVQDAIYNFTMIRAERPDVVFRMILQLHDALYFEVPIPHLKAFKTEILPLCMVQRCPVWPRYLNNQRMPVQQPYFFGIDTEISENWGEEMTEARAVELGIDPALL